MNEIELARELIEKANLMIAERDQKRYDANVYRCAIKHGGPNQLWLNRMKRLHDEIATLQEEIDYNLAFAENIIGRVAA